MAQAAKSAINDESFAHTKMNEPLLLEALQLPRIEHERVERLQIETGDRAETIVRRLGLVTDLRLAEAYAQVLKQPLVQDTELREATFVADMACRDFFYRYKLMPLTMTDQALEVAMTDPLDPDVMEALTFRFECPVRPRAALPADVDAALDQVYGRQGGLGSGPGSPSDADTRWETDLERLREEASDAPVIRRVNALIAQAVEKRASDIHIESTETGLRTRYRIDGVLSDVDQAAEHLRNAVISRLKVMANLDIAERRLAQDGRIRQVIQGKEIDFRVSTTPSAHGENVVLRVLDRDRTVLDFAELGFDRTVLAQWLATISRPHGVVLVSGPTGSGKTTTLYTSLQHLNSTERKILTVEDPIEYVMAGINQTQVKPLIGLSFANVLRSFLRQDPDIMMVGEIRDLETAQIAIQASLTGHLVLSTVHTNDAASAMARLVDMGVERYLLTSTVSGVLAQRLVRRLCHRCREGYEAPPDLCRTLGFVEAGIEAPTLFRARGCSACGQRGYVGRTMILEFLPMSDRIRSLVMQGGEAREIEVAAVQDGMQTMYRHGLRKAAAGETTIDEVMRVIGDD